MTRWSINLSLEEEEREKITKEYERNSINITARVLNLMRQDTEELEKIRLEREKS